MNNHFFPLLGLPSWHDDGLHRPISFALPVDFCFAIVCYVCYSRDGLLNISVLCSDLDIIRYFSYDHILREIACTGSHKKSQKNNGYEFQNLNDVICDVTEMPNTDK